MDKSQFSRTLAQAQFLHICGDHEGALGIYQRLLLSEEPYELLVSQASALMSLSNIDAAIAACDKAVA